MGRYFTREAALVALVITVAGIGVGALAGLGAGTIAAVTAALLLTLHWPLTAWFQTWALEWYVDNERLDRALALAMLIRDSAVIRRHRDQAAIDVALVHLSRADYENALRNLQPIVLSSLRPTARAVVQASTAYAFAHLDRQLERAEELLAAASRSVKDEPLFGYFLALVRWRQRRFAEAKALILESLEEVPDLKLPYPGERPYILAQVLTALGEAGPARTELEKARGAGRGRFAALAARELGGAAP